jgi:hypothetical protein
VVVLDDWPPLDDVFPFEEVFVLDELPDMLPCPSVGSLGTDQKSFPL